MDFAPRTSDLPKKTAKMKRDVRVRMRIQTKKRIPRMNAEGIRVLMGPYLSAIRAGRIWCC